MGIRTDYREAQEHLLELDTDRHDIYAQMNLKMRLSGHTRTRRAPYTKDGQEERPKVVEHLSEEVPPQTDVG
jgi:hypothetical protein